MECITRDKIGIIYGKMCRPKLKGEKSVKCRILLLSVVISFLACTPETGSFEYNRINDFSSLIKEFRNPGVDYRPAPLWVWNEDVSMEMIDSNLAEFKRQGVEAAFIHPRTGLHVEYLSDEWFEMVAYAIEKAKELGMKMWIYDEYVCPSGFAGGHVYNEMPESYNQGVSLVPHRMETLDLSGDFERIKYVFKSDGEMWMNVTAYAKNEEGCKGDYVVLDLRNYELNEGGVGNYAGFSYVDLLAEGVTEKFMEITMKGYEKVAAHEFGKNVPGVFTDEPEIDPGEGLRYTPDLFDEFTRKWGYSLENELMSLFYETGNWKKVRHDYRSVLLDMFIDRWSRPWYEYTEKNKLIWTGHYWEHIWPSLRSGPDNMAMYAWHQMPGIDMLFNSREKHPVQFGNNVAVKELSSIANQFGRYRSLCETYGGSGWDLTFEDMKCNGDWLYALGVNFLNPHLSLSSIVGNRKHDYPLSFMPYAPYWDLYRYQTDYFARLSVALSSGQQINRILVLNPTTSVWMYYSPLKRSGRNTALKEIGDSFKGTVQFLEDHQVEYDLGSENVIKDHGRVQAKKFIVNKRSYDLVLIPDRMENIDNATFELLKTFIANGGTVLQLGNAPQLIDGANSGELEELTRNDNWISEPDLNNRVVEEYLLSDTFKMAASPAGRLHHHRRCLKDGQVLFLSNFSKDENASTEVVIKGASVEGICPQSGEMFPVYYEKVDDKVKFSINLFPAGSYMVYIHDRKHVAPAEMNVANEKVLIKGPVSKIEKLHPNVLTIDYLHLNLMGEDMGELYYARASDAVYDRFGYYGGNPSNYVEYKSVFSDKNKTHKDGDRFEVSYSFNMLPEVDRKNMKLVVEQAALYTLTLNGREITPGGETWLDPDFNCFDIVAYVKDGRNEIILKTNHFDYRCELAPVYILGNFSLKSADRGWDISPLNEISTGSWKEQGLPFYSESVKYEKIISIENSGDYELQLPEWGGTVAEVFVNGESRGIIQSRPNSKTINISSGNNRVSVVVYASLRNLFGPHHQKDRVRGYAWPPFFWQGEVKMPKGRDYDLFDYGLIEDFRIFSLN